MADVRSPIPVCGLSWELLCVLLRMRVMCSEIAGNVIKCNKAVLGVDNPRALGLFCPMQTAVYIWYK